MPLLQAQGTERAELHECPDSRTGTIWLYHKTLPEVFSYLEKYEVQMPSTLIAPFGTTDCSFLQLVCQYRLRDWDSRKPPIRWRKGKRGACSTLQLARAFSSCLLLAKFQNFCL